jgi:hypothetical protein
MTLTTLTIKQFKIKTIMKQKSLLRSMLLLFALIVGSGTMWGQQSYVSVLTFDCATASSNGSQTAYSVASNTAMAASGIDAFLEAAASTSNKISVSNVSGSVYWAKGSGGSGIPDDCLKVGKASGGGGFTFTIDESYDAIDRIVITGYGWKTSSTISVNSLTGQSPTTAATETTFTFDFTSSTRSFALSVTSSAVCVTKIELFKTVSGTQPYINATNPDDLAYNATNGTISYEIGNFTAGLNVTASTEANWISNFQYNQTNGSGTVSFNTSVNNEAKRSATVVLTLKNANNETLSTKNVTVTQAAIPPMVTIHEPTGGTLVVKNGDATVTSGDRLPVGTVLTIVATPDETHKFRNWQYKKGTANWATKTANFDYTMDEDDVEFRANFDQTYAVNWSVNGTVVSTTRFAEGETITLADAPADIDGRKFVGWAAATISGTTDEAPTFITAPVMGANELTYYAVFASLELGENISATFKASDKSNLTQSGTTFTDNETGITLSSTSADNISFDVTTGNYYELMVNGYFTSIEATVHSSHPFSETSAGTLTTNGSTQTITFDENDGEVSTVRLTNNETNTSWISQFVVNAVGYGYVDYCTTVAPLYAVNVSDVTNGSITVKKGDKNVAGKSVYAGEVLTLTATSATGYKLKNWTATAGTITDATAATTTFTMPAQTVTIGAEFEKDSYDLALEAVGNHGSFIVTVDGETWDGTSKIPYDSEVSITANANSNFAFASWSTTLDNYDATTNPLVFNMPADDVAIQASFDDTTIEYDVVIFDEHPTGGTIGASHETATLGTEVTLTATPDDETYQFAGWEVSDGDNNPVTVTNNKFFMPASDVLVSGTFKKIYTVTYYVAGVETVVNRLDGDELDIDDPAAYNGMTFAGWSTTDNAASPSFLASTTVTSNLTLYAMFVEREGASYYEKVTSISEGDYLILNETNSQALDGSRSSSLGSNNILISVEISSNKISDPTDAINAARFHIASVTGGYSICTMDGTYIGRSESSNGLDKSKETVYVNTIEFSNENAVIKSATNTTAKLQYWKSGNNACIKYYTSTQNDIQLYKKYSNNPVYTLALPVSVKIPASGYLTYCSTSALDFSGTEVDAYTAAYDSNQGKVILTKVEDGIVPANVGVVVHSSSEPGYYPVPVTYTEKTSLDNNEMVGVTEQTAVPWTSDDKYNYILQEGKFKKATGASLTANRAYLHTSFDVTQTGGAPELDLAFGDETTSIQNIERTINDNKYYTLDGRRVETPSKGIYILNGKKVVVK